MIVERVGETALRVQFDGELRAACAQTRAVADGIRLQLADALEDVWMGARSLIATLRQPVDASVVARITAIVEDPPHVSVEPVVHTFEVRYDGADLPAIAEQLSCSVSDVIEMHAEPVYELAFIGFAPGFPYLFGTPTPLAALPRRGSPRPRVSPGSLTVAGGWTGIYPSAMPGGWNLLGTVEQPIFNLAPGFSPGSSRVYASHPGREPQQPPLASPPPAALPEPPATFSRVNAVRFTPA